MPGNTEIYPRKGDLFWLVDVRSPLSFVKVMASVVVSNDDLDLLPNQKVNDDFVMGVAAPTPTTTDGAAAGETPVPRQDETSKRLMFELLIRVGADPSIPTDELVSKHLRTLSDAIASDVEDGMGEYIAGHFVDCVKEFPTRSAIYASLFSTINIEDPVFCELILKYMLQEVNAACAEQRYRNACNALRFLTMLPKVRGVTAGDIRDHVLKPMLDQYKENVELLHPHCREQFLACLLCCVLWGGKELFGDEANASSIWQDLKQHVEDCVRARPGASKSDELSIWGLENGLVGEEGTGHCLTAWVAAIDEGVESAWSQKVIMIDLYKPLFVLVCAELDNALEPEEGSDEDGEMEPIEPVSLGAATAAISFGKSNQIMKLETYQKCIQRNDLFLGTNVKNEFRTKAMEQLTVADKCVLKQVIFSVLDVYFPMGGEAAEQLENLPVDAEHLVFECIFQVMLELPEAPHQWVYYGNVIAALCKTKKTYPPALAETVNTLFHGIAKTSSEVEEDETVTSGGNKAHLVDESFERMAQWMAWHLNRFKWKWPFKWWENSVLSRSQDAFLAAFVDRCARISFPERIQQKFPAFLHHYLSENRNVRSNPFAEVSSTTVPGSATAVGTKDPKVDVSAGSMGDESNPIKEDAIVEEPSSADDANVYAYVLGLFEANLQTEKADDTIYKDILAAQFSATPLQIIRPFVFSLFETSYSSLSEIQCRLERFQVSINEVITAVDNGKEIFLAAVGDVWEKAPTRLLHTMNYLVQLRIINGGDVIHFVFFSSSTCVSEASWFRRYWPWDLMKGALLRSLEKEFIAAPRPYAGVHRNVRDAETEKKITDEIGMRKYCVLEMSSTFQRVLQEHCGGKDGSDKKSVLLSRVECFKCLFRRSIDEFGSELPRDSLLL